MAPTIRISTMESSKSYQEEPRPASASLLSKVADTGMLVSNDSRKRKRRSLPSGDITIERARTFPSAGLSSSLDEESKMEEPLHESQMSARPAIKPFATTIDKNLSASFPSIFSNQKNQRKQEVASISTPDFKLKPRPKGRSSEHEMHLNCKISRSSFKTPPPRIFVPFLPAQGRKQSFLEETEQLQEATQKPLPPPPPMPHLQAPTIFTSPTRAKISYEAIEPELLLRPRKARRTMGVSNPLSSPPPLIPSFDFGVSATSMDAITPPPGVPPTASSYTTPLSIMVTKTPLSMASVGTPNKNIVVAKPIAKRPLITPSTLHGSSKKDSKIQKPMVFDCSPRRLFPSTFRHNNKNNNKNNNNNNIFSGRAGVGSSWLSSMESSAFSFSSSAPSSVLVYTIQRTLSIDEEE